MVPIVLMSYLSAGAMLELESLAEMRALFIDRGWTWLTALNTMLFSLLHFPCGTTLLTMAKETGGVRWPLFSFVMHTAIAVSVCYLVTQAARLLGLA